jgi:hypothetical protein
MPSLWCFLGIGLKIGIVSASANNQCCLPLTENIPVVLDTARISLIYKALAMLLTLCATVLASRLDGVLF